MSAVSTRSPNRARLMTRLARAHVNLTVHVASIERLAQDDTSIEAPLGAILHARDALARVYFFAADDPSEEALAGGGALVSAIVSLYAGCARALIAMRQHAFADVNDQTRAVLLDARLATAAHTVRVDVDAARAEIALAQQPAHFTRAAHALLDVALAFASAPRI